MMDMHPGEVELARADGGEGNADVEAHVRWCARCGNIVAEYTWMEGEMRATLATAADRVNVPRPRWWAVRAALCADRRRRMIGQWVSAGASVVLATCLMLLFSISPVLGRAAVARTTSPEALLAPAPVTVRVSSAHVAPQATPTPAMSCETATPAPTPAFVPTPPETEI